MSEIVYVSKSQIERQMGPVRYERLPGEAKPVIFSVHGAVAEHYGVRAEDFGESHATTIDYGCIGRGLTAGNLWGRAGGAQN